MSKLLHILQILRIHWNDLFITDKQLQEEDLAWAMHNAAKRRAGKRKHIRRAAASVN